MNDLGGNDPCLCGSGLKYKTCCGAKQVSSATQPWQIAKARELSAVDNMLAKTLTQKLQSRSDEVAACLIRMGVDAPASRDENVMTFIHRWMLFHLQLGSGTIAEIHERDPAIKLDATTRKRLDCQLASHLSLWQVKEVEPGRGVLLRDRLLDEDRFVSDLALSHSAVPNTGLLACFLSSDQVHVVGALHPQVLPAESFERLVEKVRGVEPKLSRQDLLGTEQGESLIALWLER